MRKTQWDKQGGARFQGPIRSAGRRAADSSGQAGESHAGRLGRGPAGHSCNVGSLGVMGHMFPELPAAARKEPTCSTFSRKRQFFLNDHVLGGKGELGQLRFKPWLLHFPRGHLGEAA